ncbi:MAG: hypothetical protein RL134_630 [Actinomycetota bacterium]|jgi:DNA-binding phage protein
MRYGLNRERVLETAAQQGLTTVVSLSDAAGVSRVALHRALSPHAKSQPTLRTLVGLSKVLGLPMEELIVEIAA